MHKLTPQQLAALSLLLHASTDDGLPRERVVFGFGDDELVFWEPTGEVFSVHLLLKNRRADP